MEFDTVRNESGGNAFVINEGVEQPERLKKLNRIAIEQMEILTSYKGRHPMREKLLRGTGIPIPSGLLVSGGCSRVLNCSPASSRKVASPPH